MRIRQTESQPSFVEMPYRFLDTPGRPRVDFAMWVRAWRAYVKLSGYMNRTGEEKISLLTLALGADGLRLCSSRPGPKDTMDQMLVELETLYTPVTSVAKERVAFWDREQDQNDIEGFAIRM